MAHLAEHRRDPAPGASCGPVGSVPPGSGLPGSGRPSSVPRGSGLPGSGGPARFPGPPGPGGPPARFAGHKVLIVDDDRRGAFALGSALTARGLTVVQAASGPEGVAALQRDPTIRAVLLDIAMPGLDGYATTARIRGLDRPEQPAIIAVTFEASATDRARALAAGMDEHVPKPVDVPRLLRLLAELMKT